MDDLVKKVRESFSKGALPPQPLLAKFKYLPTGTAERAYFYDPKYYPFFFYLGRHLQAENVLDMSLGNGIPLGCLLLGCRNVKSIVAFQTEKPHGYSARLAKHNVRTAYRGEFQSYVGSIDDPKLQKSLGSREWDTVLLTEELPYDDCLSYIRFIWPNVAKGGLLIMDRLNYVKSIGRAFKDFARTNNRETAVFDTKYGTGLLWK